MKWKIVIDDVDKAHEAYIHSYRNHPQKQAALRKESTPRAKGTIHTVCEEECPDGGSNCRNCGDPEFKAMCRAAGHCKFCGTRHGIAPTSVIEKNGYILVEDNA